MLSSTTSLGRTTMIRSGSQSVGCTLNVTMSALKVGATLAIALADQKIVLDKINSVDPYQVPDLDLKKDRNYADTSNDLQPFRHVRPFKEHFLEQLAETYEITPPELTAEDFTYEAEEITTVELELWPPNHRLVSVCLFDLDDVGPGDRVAALINGHRRELQIVGLGLSPEYVYIIPPGELVSIVGPSGCGKSTLLRIASGLEQNTAGTCAVDRDSIGYVFQAYHLLPELDVLENVMLPAMAARRLGAEQAPPIGRLRPGDSSAATRAPSTAVREASPGRARPGVRALRGARRGRATRAGGRDRRCHR